MLTVQNPKESWLATKPACSLVDDASLGPRLPPFSSGCPCLPISGGGCFLSLPPSLPLGFLGVQLACLLRCAVCLFWGADLWLRPSRQMSTIQNPKKSWLARKPACSLVDDASLGLRLPPSGSGCPRLPVFSGGWAGLQPASSVQSFVL